MYKISVQMPDHSTFVYFTALVPVTGDVISIDNIFYDVTQRRLFTDTQNFVILYVKAN